MQRAAIQYLKSNARSSTHAASAGGHGGEILDFVFRTPKIM